MLLKLALQIAHDDYQDRRERQRQGVELAKVAGKYRGRKIGLRRPNERIIALRSSRQKALRETKKLAACSPSQAGLGVGDVETRGSIMSLHEVRISPSVDQGPPLIRPAQPEDAGAMAEIRARCGEADVVPVRDVAYTAGSEAYWREYGLERRRTFVEATLANPDQYFAYTAVIGEKVVGYTGAEAPPEDEYTYWRGLNIARGYDGQGIGRLLRS